MVELKVLLFSMILSAPAGGPSYPLGPKAILLAVLLLLSKLNLKQFFFCYNKA